ncbi:MAG: UbiA family prenyltransferase [Candidatus Margulisbacteria bacterium]|nr:UbiA family prenyltransferase [Candidatus Margulisiibacteriota bacterium]
MTRIKFKIRAIITTMRLPHWLKNTLVFIPLLTSHQLTNTDMLVKNLFIFLAFSFSASGVYFLNDVLDLQADKHHHEKKSRPIASGQLSPRMGVICGIFYLLVGIGIAFSISMNLLAILIVYIVLAVSYSIKLKSYLILDVLCLSAFYTIRVIAGMVGLALYFSPWLLIFSMFMFLSLGFIKRSSELHNLRLFKEEKAKGRGYVEADLEHLTRMGIAAGYNAVLVLALYINSDQIRSMYVTPEWLWLLCPIVVYWISRMWMITNRGNMPEDPVMFAIKDRPSLGIVITIFSVMVLAMVS